MVKLKLSRFLAKHKLSFLVNNIPHFGFFILLRTSNFLSTKFSKAIIDIVACIITNVIQYKNLMHEYSMKTCFSKCFWLNIKLENKK